MTGPGRATVWVFGDQLNRSIGALATAEPATHRILLVESEAKITGRRWHRQRLHLHLRDRKSTRLNSSH